MLTRKRHPNKEIESAIQFAEENSWTFKPPGKSAHAFGILKCPHNDRECRCGRFCKASVWRTPRSSENEAGKIRKVVENCIHQSEQGNEDQVEKDD